MSDLELLAWIQRGQLIAALLVAVGVAGEFAGSFIARPINRRIEAARKEDDLQRQSEIAPLNKEAGEARQKVADALERTAQANRIAEQERLERVKIQEKLADRRLNLEQRDRTA